MKKKGPDSAVIDNPLPILPSVPPEANISEMVEVDPQDWFIRVPKVELAGQVFSQENRHAIILLHAASAEEDEVP